MPAKNDTGFTLIETLIAVTIIILIGAASFVSFVQSRKIRELADGGQAALSILRLAQSKSLAGENNAPWGVHLDINQVVIFQGAIYAGSPVTIPYPLANSLEIANINIGGGSDIIFQKISGATNQAGSFDVRVKSSLADTFPVTVENSGKVYRTGAAPVSAGTRIVDTRHRLFTLGWSIKDTTTLTLRWNDPPNPDTVQNIVMSPYFDAGKTKFDWSGNYAVGGRAQELRVHTTSLSDSDTTLSIDRDCRKNSKKIKISIDARDIATYEADCRTITVEAFGGTMNEL